MSGILNGHPNQSAELTDTMIDVHHVVAHLKLLNLLQRQGHLTASGLVGTQVILMETVEYLVVGKDADPLVVIDESCMERLLHRLKTDSTLFGKDILQALQLLDAVCQDIKLVVLSQILLQRLFQQFEILVELGLWSRMERQRCIGRTRRVRTNLHPSETQHLTTELRPAHQLQVTLHLHSDIVLFHLGGSLQTFCQCLL